MSTCAAGTTINTHRFGIMASRMLCSNTFLIAGSLFLCIFACFAFLRCMQLSVVDLRSFCARCALVWSVETLLQANVCLLYWLYPATSHHCWKVRIRASVVFDYVVFAIVLCVLCSFVVVFIVVFCAGLCLAACCAYESSVPCFSVHSVLTARCRLWKCHRLFDCLTCVFDLNLLYTVISTSMRYRKCSEVAWSTQTNETVKRRKW